MGYYDKQRKELAKFLQERRRRIDFSASKLGDFLRQPHRIGRPVTQEEIAEAVAVSRVWYASLESGTAARPSPSLLDRLARAFELSNEERRTLFELGIPELNYYERRYPVMLENRSGHAKLPGST